MKKIIFLWICSVLIGQVDISFPTLSPITTIHQEVGLTTIELSYSRPSAKGRTVFGELVPFNTIWRTGANASTKITFHENVTINNVSVDKGTYALYTIPNKEEWIIIIHKNIKMRSIAGDVYKEKDDLMRFKVKSQTIKNKVETFTIQFSDIKTNNVNLSILWENTRISFPIFVEVDSKIEYQITQALKQPETIDHGTYFRIAEYYLHNNKNLKKSLNWINEALIKSPENFRYGLLKSKILYKMGDNDNAILVIKQANIWAIQKQNANYIEQTSLFMKEITSGKND